MRGESLPDEFSREKANCSLKSFNHGWTRMDTDKKWIGMAGSPLPAVRETGNHGAHGVTRPAIK
jgi:hypothetical protein